MKTPAELAASRLDSPDTHKKRATSLRRLAGGLNAVEQRGEATGLSMHDLRALQDAKSVLKKLATAYGEASKVAQQRRDDEDRAEKAIRAAMAANFEQLTTIPDRVALIAAVQSYVLRDGYSVKTVRDLDYHFQDAIRSLAYTLAGLAKGRSALDVVNEAWGKFSNGRSELEAKYVTLIGRLIVDEQSTALNTPPQK